MSAVTGKPTLSTRQRRNSRLVHLPVPLVLVLLLGYFLYHAWSDNKGVEALDRIAIEQTRLEFELLRLEAERNELEARVELMRDGAIEKDMLDEQARAVLGLLGPREIAILR